MSVLDRFSGVNKQGGEIELFTNAGVTPSASDRNAAINEFGSAADTSVVNARSRALRDVAENSLLQQQEINRAFVLMQYFGYLRRDPNSGPDADYTGYDFWLRKLNQIQRKLHRLRDGEGIYLFKRVSPTIWAIARGRPYATLRGNH